MANIAYRYRTPIPMIFWKNGALDPSKKIYKNRLAFLTWTFSQCHYDRFQFSCSREESAGKSGMTIKEWRTQEQYFIETGFLIKGENPIHDRSSHYQWNMEKITEEKIIEIERASQIASQVVEIEKDMIVNEIERASQTEKGPVKGPAEGPAILREEIEKKGQPDGQPKGHVYINDNKAINLPLYNSDKVSNPRACEDLSLFHQRQSIAFFDPRKYRLRNKQPLSPWMQNALNKYSPEQWKRLLANVSYYEEWVDSGKPIKTTHEAFLQVCIKKDLAQKQDNTMKNDLTAQFVKIEYKVKEMEILKTVIQIKRGNSEVVSIPKDLPPVTFSDVLNNHLQKIT